MLSYLLKQLFNSLGVFFRTIRAFFTRKLMGAVTHVRRITNFSRQASRVAATSFQEAAVAVKKPSKREDYIETKRLFISKSFLILAAVALIVIGLLVYFVIWPFVLSHFLTARFYQGDARLQDWSGRVIVYYDEKKQIPMYSGTLEKGILQGRGTEYDEQGLLTYEGNFVDGLYSGNGTSYDSGILVYDGQFLDGLYEGTGSLYEDGSLVYYGAFSVGLANGLGTAYQDGAKCYEGTFVSGLYEGEGTEYYVSGSVAYKGSFSAGSRDGVGTLYYESGSRAYVGSFAEGLREGEGTEYNEDGSVHYKGSFVQDLYDGSGSVFLEDGSEIQAEFTAGVTNGTIQWYRNGQLWYEGGADDLTPDGFGTVYGTNGKVIYTGEMDEGTLDGEWLLSLTAEKLREAFGEAELTETDQEKGFLIENPSMGISVLCSYRQEDQEASVYQVWFQPETGSEVMALLPWNDQSQAVDWAVEGRSTTSEARAAVRETVQLPDGTADDSWWTLEYTYEDYTCTLLCRTGEGMPVQIVWSGGGELNAPEGVSDETASQTQEQLDELIEALEQISGGADGEVNQGDVKRLLGLMLTASDAKSLVDALTNYYVYDKMIAALESCQPLLEQYVAEEQVLLERGAGSQAAVDSAQNRLDQLNSQLAQYRTYQEQAKTVVQQLSKLDPGDYDLQAVLVCFNAAEMNVSSLYDAALTYAKQVAAGLYTVDAAQLEVEIKSKALNLNMAYETVLSAQQELARLTAALEAQAAAYAKGTADKTALYEAQCAVSEGIANLYQAMGAFTAQANELNDLSGGWIANQYGWMSDTFAVIFRNEVIRGEQAAAEAEAERQRREEEAAQAIQNGQETETTPEETGGENTAEEPEETVPDGEETPAPADETDGDPQQTP